MILEIWGRRGWGLWGISNWSMVCSLTRVSHKFYQFLYLSMWNFSSNPMILFLLKTGGNWQWYSTYTLNSWKIISNTQILSFCNNFYTYWCRFWIIIQQLYFYWNRVETDDGILHILQIVGKSSVTHKFCHFVTILTPIDVKFQYQWFHFY